MTGNRSDDWQQAALFLKEGTRFLVVSHVHPDGDAIGSTLAVKAILDFLGKESGLTNESPVPSKFRFLPGSEAVVPPQNLDGFAFDRVVAVDVADRGRMGAVWEHITADIPLLNIDHHPTNDRFGTVNLVVEDAAATTQILFHLARKLDVPFDRALAIPLYTGLLTDTGGFRYSNTNPEVMEMAAALLRHGVDAGQIAERVMETLTRGQLAILQRALSDLQFTSDGRVGWIWLTCRDLEEAEAEEDDLDGIVNYARNVAGVDVGILFRETEAGNVKVSLRSREIVDVAALAHSFGGGGHARAAGCTLSGSREEVESQLLEKVMASLEQGGD
ncbi:DHH family phosphoesterase [Desmospora profundinema]|uniref:Phosphoesterase RecJ-like protein n=1 Tax=Desmospora profundinema TaxID=1571184 RepID=A0ABU1IHH3_9BACL|nr:bifunctional oligoribonuclease/PAP phosphatase NrnA [Desmospora profundinema]MDR6224218.1 phosphoesterase RecJ-like protein [Desmospora profundinema]